MCSAALLCQCPFPPPPPPPSRKWAEQDWEPKEDLCVHVRVNAPGCLLEATFASQCTLLYSRSVVVSFPEMPVKLSGTAVAEEPGSCPLYIALQIVFSSVSRSKKCGWRISFRIETMTITQLSVTLAKRCLKIRWGRENKWETETLGLYGSLPYILLLWFNSWSSNDS